MESNHDNAGALETFQQYTKAFGELDAAAVAQHFHEPAMLITPLEIFSFPTRAAVEQAYARIMSELPTRGYVRTEFTPLSAHRLGDDLVMVSGGGSWKNAANENFMQFGMTYTLKHTPQGWRIVVDAVHAPVGTAEK